MSQTPEPTTYRTAAEPLAHLPIVNDPVISAARRALNDQPDTNEPEPNDHAPPPCPTLPRGTVAAPPTPLPAAKPVECSTAATLPIGPGWTLRLHVHPAPIELDLVCAHCGNGYSLDLDQRGNGALVRLILDTHQHPQEPTR